VDKEKIPIGEDIFVKMEKASRLNVVSGFEKRLLSNRMMAIEDYGMKAVITKAQIEVIEEMARRYDLAVGG